MKPTIWLAPRAYHKARIWARLATSKFHTEVGTVASVELDADGDVVVTDCYLVDQVCTSANTDMSEQDKARLFGELLEHDEDIGTKLIGWIHAHPGTGKQATYLSDLDEATIEKNLTGPMFVSIVVDEDGENHYGRIDIRVPFRAKIEADVRILLPGLSKEDKADAVAEFDRRVQRAMPAFPTVGKHGAWPSQPTPPVSDPRSAAAIAASFKAAERTKKKGKRSKSTVGTPEVDTQDPVVASLLAMVNDMRMLPSEAVEQCVKLGYDRDECIEVFTACGYDAEPHWWRESWS